MSDSKKAPRGLFCGLGQRLSRPRRTPVERRHGLCLNGGVKVAVEHEQAIEHLKELEARGTTVLVCGACLNFFGMTDDLKAGTLSNMYDILTAMQNVDKVISL